MFTRDEKIAVLALLAGLCVILFVMWKFNLFGSPVGSQDELTCVQVDEKTWKCH